MHELDADFLRRAIERARSALAHGNDPYGAILVSADQQILLEAENTSVSERDCTGHAETNLVREASRRFSPAELAGATLYSSAEPCAMCAAAIHWANIGRLVFAASQARIFEILGDSPEHLRISCRELFAHSQRPIEIVGPLLEDEAFKAMNML